MTDKEHIDAIYKWIDENKNTFCQFLHFIAGPLLKAFPEEINKIYHEIGLRDALVAVHERYRTQGKTGQEDTGVSDCEGDGGSRKEGAD